MLAQRPASRGGARAGYKYISVEVNVRKQLDAHLRPERPLRVRDIRARAVCLCRRTAQPHFAQSKGKSRPVGLRQREER
jgi:hypothetical protein